MNSRRKRLLPLVAVGAVLVVVGIALAIHLLRDRKAPDAVVLTPKNKETTREVGREYRVEASARVHGKGFAKNWGVSHHQKFEYLHAAIFDSKVTSKSPERIVEERHYDECYWLFVVHSEGVKLSEGWHAAAIAVGGALGGPAGAVEGGVAAATFEKILDGAVAGQLLFNKREVSPVKGRSYRITYDIAKEVRMKVEREGGGAWTELADGDKSLAEERGMVLSHHILMDANVFSESDSYTIDARDLALAIDPELDAIPTGTLSARRDGEEAFDGARCQRVRIGGEIEYVGTGNWIEEHEAETVATLTVRTGQLLFDTDLRIVRLVEATGSGRYEEISRDHVLFEARIEGQPEIELRYKATRR